MALCFSSLFGMQPACAAGVGPQATFREAERIVTPARTGDGIDRQGYVRIGGIDQWISVRGRHRDAPILLFLHGGPGFTSIPHAYYYMQGWEEYFTVVQWDQRGAGKTYLANDPSKIRPTMTIDRMVDDAEDVVRYLRETYRQKRIVLMAHSWGTVLGVRLAQRHPDWFYAYVGMGQVVDMAHSEALGYQATLAVARADHSSQAQAELEALAPFPDPQHPENAIAKLKTERHWLEHYDGDADYDQADIEDFSPDYSAQDLRGRSDGLTFSLQALWVPLGQVDFTSLAHFGCPVVFFQGRYDLTTSSTLLGQWYATLDAPYKKLVWFDDSAHMVYEEEPGRLLVALVQDVLPLTHTR